MRRNDQPSTGGGQSSSSSSLDALSGGALGQHEHDTNEHGHETANTARRVPGGLDMGQDAAEEDGESTSELGERRISAVQSAGQSSVHGRDRQASEGHRPQHPPANTAAAIASAASASAASASASATTASLISAAAAPAGGRRRVRSMPLDDIDDIMDDDDDDDDGDLNNNSAPAMEEAYIRPSRM